ncbi:Putative transposase for insertion sequence element IS112 [Frankliniella fusca]|uniref:Transposase for insertion sequence element IS112 n=1 Tax=Frankliniella fusca TaxID=407009 RepID=A0AAE1LCH8_9NEOP|nr:Putative transposase for insertion sequence element IS112 [Frankliniella fusca]
MRSLPFRKFSSKNRLFMMLVRMRRGVPLIDLAYIFGISKARCQAICYAMIRLTYEYLVLLEPYMFITAEQQKKNMPAPFRAFKNLRVIIDCAEFHIQKPSDFQQQGNTFSNYKHYNTQKYLIGISCYGSIIFCSGGFEGNKSDKEILNESGMMKYLQKGDSVMADRGFNVRSELADIGVNLIKPSNFKKSKQFLKPSEEVLTKDTASARIFVEHAIKSIKDWRLLRNIIPMSLHDILPDMVFIAAYLTNFNKPFIKLAPGTAK